MASRRAALHGNASLIATFSSFSYTVNWINTVFVTTDISIIIIVVTKL